MKKITVNEFDYGTNTFHCSTHFLSTFAIIGSVSFNPKKEIFSALVNQKKNGEIRIESKRYRKLEKLREIKEYKERRDGKRKRGILLLEKSNLSFTPLKRLDFNI